MCDLETFLIDFEALKEDLKFYELVLDITDIHKIYTYIYLNKFIGTLRDKTYKFSYTLSAFILALKFLEDEYIGFSTFGYTPGRDIKAVKKAEIMFIKQIDYQLYIKSEEVQQYTDIFIGEI